MTLTATDIFVAVVLFSCVPLQYYVVRNWGNFESNRAYTLKRISDHVSDFYEEYLTFGSWRRWISQLLNIPSLTYPNEPDDLGQSPAIEVDKFKEKNEFFSMSTEPRIYRSPDMLYRIGQVVEHKADNYKGVIIGWDEKAKAPSHVLETLHGNNKSWRSMPHYSILIDTRDKLLPSITYAPQEYVVAIKNTRIFHPLLDHYFENYDGVQYIPRPWLQAIYPQDKTAYSQQY